MCEITIAPSPNWYFSNILACNDEGTAIAYAAKHEVVILRQITNHGKPCDAQPIFIPMAHKEKISAVSFSPSNCENFRDHLVSCSDDGTVHVWNWPSQFLILAHSGHPDGQKLVGVDWSRADPNLIVSVSEFSSVVCWDLPSNTIRRLSINSKVSPICMSCCPHNKELIAVGAKAGLTVIYNIKGDGFTLFRLRAHETDVVSLAWCPVPYNIFQKDGRENTYLLASGAKDRNIYFWRAGTDGRYETFITLPPNPVATTGYRSKNGVGGMGSHWICVRWPDPNTIVTSSLFGELISYDLQQLHNSPANDKTKDKKGKIKAMKLIHGNHTKGLFSIAIPNSAKKEGDDRVVWTYALDKRLIASKLESSKVLSSMATIGGIVYCMAVCPLDPNRIAIGTGDNRILVWNMSNDSCDNITCLWNRINNKVMALAWHPTLESMLAFGTGEGRIGLVDVDNATKPTTLLRLYHRKSVYSLIWGPPVVDDMFIKGKKALSLFSVGDGDILQYNLDTPDKDPISLNPLFKACDNIAKVSKSLGRTDLAWNSSRSLAAVGNDNGVLYIVDGRDMSHVHTIFAHKKLVQCIVWHPATVTSESTPSPYASWLASASDNIQIVNVTATGVEVVACLSTHSEKVVSLAWSPHFNSRLVSASYDYTSQVWDVASGSVLACFDGHHSAVMCCLPSMLHPDCVITGSADSTVRLWNVNKYKLTKTKTKKQRLSGVLKKFAGVQEAKDAKNSVEFRMQTTTNGFKNDLREDVAPQSSSNIANTDQQINRPKRNKSMFPVTSGGTSQAKHINILWSRIKGEPPTTTEENEYGYLDFFGDTNSIRRLLDVEGNHHKTTGNFAYTRHLSLWSGNISETIKDAIWKKELNDHLVSLAPMVSHKLWVDCCRSYATQLAEVGDIYKAVSYLLAIHQVEEAIDLLTEGKYFREAVVLAKSRFPTFDPIVKRVLDAWTTHCVSTGMLSLAAHCALSNGSNIEAVEILSRSKDDAFISLAAEIASKSDAHEMAVSLALRAINGSLEKLDFELARKTALQHPSLKETLCWIEICSLIAVWKPLSSADAISWICGLPNTKHCCIFEKAVKLCGGNASYNKLIPFMPNKPTDDSENKVWVYISGQLCLAGSSEDHNISLRHLVQAVAAAYRYHVHNPSSSARIFLQLCPWLSPSGPLNDIKIIEKCDESLKESLHTFFASSVVYWLEELIRNAEFPLDDNNIIEKINDVVKKSAVLVFHKDILNYYKYDVELKKLESSIAVNKLKLLKSMKYCKEIEASLQGEPDNLNGESAIDTNGALENQETSEGNPSPEENVSEKTEDDAEKYNKLKSLKAKFEEERIDTPNPFILYCTMRSFMQRLMEKNEKSKETMEEISNEIVGKGFE